MDESFVGKELVDDPKKNTGIVGVPRSGKTKLAQKMFDSYPDENCAIFVDPQFEGYFPKNTILRTTDGFSIHDRPKTVFNLDENEQLIPLIVKLFDGQKKAANPKKIRLIIDEVYMFQEYDNAKRMLTKLTVDGLKWGIQTIVTAHYPQMVLPAIYRNLHQYYFFKLNNALFDYFKRIWRINLFPLGNYLSINYNYVFYDGNEFYLKDGRKVQLNSYKDTLQIEAEVLAQKKTIPPLLKDNMTMSELIQLTQKKK